MKIIVGITGASGAIYGYTLIRVLHELNIDVHLIMTEMGEKVLTYECGVKKEDLEAYATIERNDDLFSAIASGSVKVAGMVILPCSMNSLGAIANGVGDRLLFRAASVTLKEKRKLVIVPRETPLSIIHLKNLVTLAEAGAHILPASPAFYMKPTEVWELVNFVLARILDYLDIDHELMKRWRE